MTSQLFQHILLGKLIPTTQELNLHEWRWCLWSKLNISLLVLTLSTKLDFLALERAMKKCSKMQSTRAVLAEPLSMLNKTNFFVWSHSRRLRLRCPGQTAHDSRWWYESLNQHCLSLATFRSEYEYDYEVFVLSTRTCEIFNLWTYCACSVRKTSRKSYSDLKVAINYHQKPIRVETCNGPLCAGKQASKYSIF